MILLAAYAVIVWALIARTRRTWVAFALALMGGAAVLGAMAVIAFISRASGGADVRTFSALLWVEGVIVTLVGLFIAVLPNRRDVGHCPFCRYDMTGHTHEVNPICPECGIPRDGYASTRRQRPDAASMREALAQRKIAAENEFSNPVAASIATRLAAEHAAKRAVEQDRDRQDRDEAPAERAEQGR